MKGVYCLIIQVKKDLKIKVGALGRINFRKGNYCYVGSGQNNVEKRIKRHFSKKKKIRWHIDYLLKNPDVNVKRAVYKHAGKDMECKIACMFSEIEEPIKNFGSSDCKCSSHLFRLESLKSLKKIKWHANG
ncbi:MAG: GIY-YIG nuclease family protein [Nanoarchaeota archaeon]|nr:GIY-YIG nuclease family protein [Nanoarchaeota archaeon]